MIDKITYLETEKEKYPILFNINVLEAIQDEYGSFSKWDKLLENKKEPSFKALKFGLREAINEAIDVENETLEVKRPFVTSKQVGRILTEVGYKSAAGTLKTALVAGSNGAAQEEKNLRPMRRL